jgi:hypothetical protein
VVASAALNSFMPTQPTLLLEDDSDIWSAITTELVPSLFFRRRTQEFDFPPDKLNRPFSPSYFSSVASMVSPFHSIFTPPAHRKLTPAAFVSEPFSEIVMSRPAALAVIPFPSIITLPEH